MGRADTQARRQAMLEYDQEQRALHGLCCGVDEAGRGPLAGDVYAAAVLLNPDNPIEGLDDSKKLSEKRREQLFVEIKKKALCYAIASASVDEIEEYNILGAAMLAMQRAVEALHISPDYALIDGNRFPPIGLEGACVIKGDATSASIAAASILAKVERDHAMLALDEMYPEYGFAKHKGYGTALHREMLQRYGVSPVHRPSFLKKIL